MNFYTVMRWLFTASDEERAALKELLNFMHLGTWVSVEFSQPPHEAPDVAKIKEGTQVLDRNGNVVADPPLKPYAVANTFSKAQIAQVNKTVDDAASARRQIWADAYRPKDAFSKRWWKTFSAQPAQTWTPREMAEVMNEPQFAYAVSNTLGALYKRGIVTRKKDGRAYRYSLKRG